MTLQFFKGKKGNWICLCQNEEMIVANGELSEKEIISAINNGEGHKAGKNYLVGFGGGETLDINVKSLKLTATAEADKPVIEWEEV